MVRHFRQCFDKRYADYRHPGSIHRYLGCKAVPKSPLVKECNRLVDFYHEPNVFNLNSTSQDMVCVIAFHHILDFVQMADIWARYKRHVYLAYTQH